MKIWKRLKWALFGGDIPPERSSDSELVDGFIGYHGNPHRIGTEKQIDEATWVATLEKHPLMVELKEWKEYRIKVLAIDDSMKRKMASYYLELMFGELYDAIYKFIVEHDTYLDDTVALNNLLISTITNVGMTAHANGVPEIFLDKFTNYLYAQNKVLDSTYKDLDRYEYYNNPLKRASFRLDLGFLMIRSITSEVETVINEMNGELHAALEGSLFDV